MTGAMHNGSPHADEERPVARRRHANRRVLELLGRLVPPGPRHWVESTRRLANKRGWMPPFFVFSFFGCLIAARKWWGGLALLQWQVTPAALVISVLATALLTRRSIVAIRRYGVGGPLRTRWWFELSRVAFLVLGLVLVTRGIGGPQLLPRLRVPLEVATVLSFVLFVLTGTIAYIVAILTGQPKRGKAWQCVRFYYFLMIGSLAGSRAVQLWPPPALWPQGAVWFAFAAAGTGLWLFAAWVMVREFERSEKDDK